MAVAERAEREHRAREFALPALPARLAQIDLLKGLAILAVLALHTLTAAQLSDSAARFWIAQAVPVFVVLMGLNATGSMWRRGRAGLRELYSRRYLLSRLDRLYVPFLPVLAVSCAVALVRGTLTPGGIVAGLVVGLLPYSGPGNYFITFAFQFAVLFPLFYWAYRRAPAAVVVAGFAAAAVFELAAPHVAVLAQHITLFESLFVRFLPYVALGAMLADRMVHGRGLPRWWWLAGAISVAYLVALTVDASVITISLAGLRDFGQTSLGAFYPALLIALGLRWLPRTATSAPARLLATLGIASYEIFLVQILWFSLVSAQKVAMFVPSAIACCAIGYALHVALRRVPKLAEAPLSSSQRRGT
jgi:peptidoglycan/LPS O-acetylase OafA/YrhL